MSHAVSDRRTPKSNSGPHSWSDHKAAAFIVVLLLVAHAGLAFDVARRFTVTHDEYWHIPAGLLNLQTGRFDYDNLNPPLIRMVAATPLWLSGTEAGELPDNADPRMVGDAFIDAHTKDGPQEYSQVVLWARIPIILLSILTGWMLATWALQEFGAAAAIMVAVFWSASPMVLGCASLVTTDLGAGALFVAVIWRAWRYAGDPSWANAMWMAAAIGLAVLAKYTCVLAIPFAIATWWFRRCFNADRIRQNPLATLFQWTVAAVVSIVLINAGYMFDGTGTKLGDYKFRSVFLTKLQQSLPSASLLVPFPKDLVEGIDHQKMMMEGNHPVFLDGNWAEHGSYDYFAKAIAYKVPHAFQLCFLLAVIFAVTQSGRRHLRFNLTLLLPLLTLLILASGSGMQLGLRYIFPVFPLAFVFMSQLGSIRWKPSAGSIVVGLAVLGCLASIRHHPNHIAYFNEASGGIKSGRNHLLDSNIDWGQDLSQLPEFMTEKKIEKIGLAYFGMVPPDRYGIDFTIPSVAELKPGWYAISVNFVKGRPHTIRNETGEVQYSNIGAYSIFSLLKPVAKLGESIDIYNVSEFDIAEARSRMR